MTPIIFDFGDPGPVSSPPLHGVGQDYLELAFRSGTITPEPPVLVGFELVADRYGLIRFPGETHRVLDAAGHIWESESIPRAGGQFPVMLGQVHQFLDIAWQKCPVFPPCISLLASTPPREKQAWIWLSPTGCLLQQAAGPIHIGVPAGLSAHEKMHLANPLKRHSTCLPPIA